MECRENDSISVSKNHMDCSKLVKQRHRISELLFLPERLNFCFLLSTLSRCSFYLFLLYFMQVRTI